MFGNTRTQTTGGGGAPPTPRLYKGGVSMIEFNGCYFSSEEELKDYLSDFDMFDFWSISEDE